MENNGKVDFMESTTDSHNYIAVKPIKFTPPSNGFYSFSWLAGTWCSKEMYDKLKQENERLRFALGRIQLDAQRNASGKQPYGGVHSPLDEFAIIESIATEALRGEEK